MNKQRSNFRKCAFCPHHNDKLKCCCKKSIKTVQNNKKSRGKQFKIANESSIRVIDQNFNQLNLNLNPLIAQNSKLKLQNKNLKENLLSLSYCINEEKIPCKQYLNISTSTTLRTQSQHNLSDRLYLSNKNLQQAVFRIDTLSKQNKQLNQRNSKLISQLECLRLENSQLKEDILNLKRHIKKEQSRVSHIADKTPFNDQVKIYRQKYQNLKFQNSSLVEQIQRLKHIIQNRASQKIQNMSPEWVAQTSNKLSFIEQKIQIAQNKIKNPSLNENCNQSTYLQSAKNNKIDQKYQNVNNLAYYDIINGLKNDLALSINTIHSKTRKFNSLFDNIGNINNISMTQLICTLMEGFVEASLNQNNAFQKQMKRKILVIQKRMDNLLGKLENLILSIKNKELRNRSTSRSRVLLSNKTIYQQKSPLLKRNEKQNINQTSNIDKSY